MIVLVEQGEIANREALSAQADHVGEALLKTQKVKDMLATFEALLDNQTSMAARHRFLKAAGLEWSSIATFRNRWVSAKHWIDQHISASNLTDVMTVLNIRDNAVLDEIKKIDGLRKALDEPPPTIDHPIYEIKRLA